jgi:hypothetical protein
MGRHGDTIWGAGGMGPHAHAPTLEAPKCLKVWLLQASASTSVSHTSVSHVCVLYQHTSVSHVPCLCPHTRPCPMSRVCVLYQASPLSTLQNVCVALALQSVRGTGKVCVPLANGCLQRLRLTHTNTNKHSQTHVCMYIYIYTNELTLLTLLTLINRPYNERSQPPQPPLPRTLSTLSFTQPTQPTIYIYIHTQEELMLEVDTCILLII